MKIFIIPKGTEVILSNDNGETKKVISKKEAIFDLEDIIEDPVSYYNKQLNSEIKDELKEQFCTIDYFKFKLKHGVHTVKNFNYAYIDYRKVKTLAEEPEY